MPKRKNLSVFAKECGGMVFGYRLRDGQAMPETYGELVLFMVDRLRMNPEDDPSTVLSEWLMREDKDPVSCSPNIDTSHVEAVILIGELNDPDSYVAQIPDEMEGMLPIPPPDLIRTLIDSES